MRAGWEIGLVIYLGVDEVEEAEKYFGSKGREGGKRGGGFTAMIINILVYYAHIIFITTKI